MVRNPRGTHFRTMGRAEAGGVRLGGEEALYLLERGALGVWWGGDDEGEEKGEEGEKGKEDEKGEEEEKEEGVVPMSLQAGYACLIGGGSGLSLERFTVYAGLKRCGYIVQRGPGWDKNFVGGEFVREERSAEERPLGLFARIYRALFEGRRRDPPPLGPLVGAGVYRSYSQLGKSELLWAALVANAGCEQMMCIVFSH